MSSSLTDPGAARPARWPWFALTIFFVIAIVGLVVVAVNGGSLAEQVPFVITFAMFGIVGSLIASRDRRNVIGSLMLYASLVTAWGFLCSEFATWFASRGDGGVLAAVLALFGSFTWLFGILPTLFLLPLLFPDGHLPSRRWRPFLWLILGFLVVLFVTLVFGDKTLTGSNDADAIANPFYISAIGRLPSLDPLINLGIPILIATSIGSLFVRFRRSSGVARQQIKWVVFGFLAAFVGLFASDLVKDPFLNSLVGGGAFLAFPVSIGIAVLRFHLYDLDVVVKKAVVYAALALFATTVYLGLVIGLGAALGRGSSFLTMVAAVVVAVTFQPIRIRLTRFANRMVYGKRATPYEVLSEFSERVGGAYADDDVLPRMARILGEGIGAERADVWLAVDGELRDVAAWPADTPGSMAIPLTNGAVGSIEGADRVYPVEQAGELLGALAVRKPSSDPVSPSDEKLMADLAAQVGLVLRNVRLTEELKARLDDLKAAQKRLVSAQDEERRKLERNIHDGAQQQLVALAVKLRLADGLVERDAPKARELLGQLQGETNTALEDLRDLARGIYPPLLADKGLVAALEAQARKSGLPVEVRTGGIGRYPQAVEAAVYFCCLEGLQNIAKYAEASSVTISLGEHDRRLVFSVADDGRGFDPAISGNGSGLQGIAARLGAIDGHLSVTSSPGGGTTIEGSLPAAALVEVNR